MTATKIQLTGVTTAASGSTTNMTGDGVDLGGLGHLTVWVNRSVAAAADSGSYVTLQTSMSPNTGYVDLSPPIDLTRTGVAVRHYINEAQYIRWSATVSGGTNAQFSIDLIARES